MNSTALQLASRNGARKSNLAFALYCLPRDRRSDALTFYDFCRTVDDIADGDLPPSEKSRLLGHWKEAISSGQGIPPLLADVIDRRALDRTLLVEIILGVEMDIAPRSYATYDDLSRYCWRVACAVGLASLSVFGCSDPRSKEYAERLGYALQLTNILRDVAEDARAGRVYLPLEDMTRFGVSKESLLALQPTGDFLGLMQSEAGRANVLFAQASSSLPPRDAHLLLPAEMMRAMYQHILHRMSREGFRVLEKRYRLSLADKLLIVSKTLVASLFTRASGTH